MAGCALVMLARAAQAQEPAMPVRPELRLDGIFAQRRAAVQVGGGLQIPAGYYARIGVDGAVGPERSNGESQLSGRVDVIARFLFDPFRQANWALSAGGGISVIARRTSSVQPYLVGVMDLEGPRNDAGFAPVIQLGLGGGTRIGLLLRWASPRVR